MQRVLGRSRRRARSLCVSLLRLLFRRKRWVLGWVLGVVGIAPQVFRIRERAVCRRAAGRATCNDGRTWTSAKFGGAPIGIGLLIALVRTIVVSRTKAVSELSAATQR